MQINANNFFINISRILKEKIPLEACLATTVFQRYAGEQYRNGIGNTIASTIENMGKLSLVARLILTATGYEPLRLRELLYGAVLLYIPRPNHVVNPKIEENKNKKKSIGIKLDICRNLEDGLNKSVIGQNQVIKQIVPHIQDALLNLMGSRSHPQGVFLFMGPSGVGKTLLAKTIATLTNRTLTRINMNQLNDAHAVSSLEGAPYSYKDSDVDPPLVKALRNSKNSVIVFDELEKAHPSVIDALLALIDDGKFQTGKTETLDATGAIFVFTSNAGTKQLSQLTNPNQKQLRDALLTAQNLKGKPEFLNRMQLICPFSKIDKKDFIKIIALELNKRIKQYKAGDWNLNLSIDHKKVDNFLYKKYDSQQDGKQARGISHFVEQQLKFLIIPSVINEKVKTGASFRISCDSAKLTICEIKQKTPKLSLSVWQIWKERISSLFIPSTHTLWRLFKAAATIHFLFVIGMYSYRTVKDSKFIQIGD